MLNNFEKPTVRRDPELFEKPTTRVVEETQHESPQSPGSSTTPQGLRSFGLPHEGDIVADRFRVGKRIGAGGMGAVYEATDLSDNSHVALKAVAWGDESIAGQVIGRMRREARVIGQIRSPNVIRLVGDGLYMHGDMPTLAMERLHGEDLHRVGVRCGKLPPDTVLKIGLQAARGLAAAHRAGIVHRDVKPPNLFLARERKELVVKVLDFGIARAAEAPESQTAGLTQTGTILGSPAYMSPEQIQATSAVTAEADLWSLWITLYQLMTGFTPHALDVGSAVGALLVRICAEPAPALKTRIPTISRFVNDAFLRGLDLDREHRFPTADHMAMELERLLVSNDATLTLEDIRAADSQLEVVGHASMSPPAPIKPAVVGWGSIPPEQFPLPGNAASGAPGNAPSNSMRPQGSSHSMAPRVPLVLSEGVDAVAAIEVAEVPRRGATPASRPRYDLIVGGVIAVVAIVSVLVAVSTARISSSSSPDTPDTAIASPSGRAGRSAATGASAAALAAAGSAAGVIVPQTVEGWVKVPAQTTVEVNGQTRVPEGDRVKVNGTVKTTLRFYLKRGHIAREVMVTLTPTGPVPDVIEMPNVAAPPTH